MDLITKQAFVVHIGLQNIYSTNLSITSYQQTLLTCR